MTNKVTVQNSLIKVVVGPQGPAGPAGASANNTSAIWNANKLQGYDISTTGPTSGQVPTWIASTSSYVPQTPPGAGGGEANTISGVGPGTNLVFGKSSVNLQIKTLQASGGTVLSSGASTVTIFSPDGITGPSTATINAIAVFGDTSGNSVKNSLPTINTSGEITASCLTTKGTFGLIGSDETGANRTLRIGVSHHSSAEEPATVISYFVQSAQNSMNIGGGTSFGNAATRIALLTAPNTSTVTGFERAVFDASGNVHIASTLNVSGDITTSSFIRVGSLRFGPGSLGGDIESTGPMVLVTDADNNGTTSDFIFFTNADGVASGGTELFRITDEGLIKVPGQFNVSGTVNASGEVFANSVNVNYLDLASTASEPTRATGRGFWDDTYKTVSLCMHGANVTLQVGQEGLAYVRNNSGSAIANGKPISITGAQGNIPTIGLTDISDMESAESFIGLTTEDINNNSNGYIAVWGAVRAINTSAFSEGDRLYIDTTPGTFTTTAPTAPNYICRVGRVQVSHSVTGEIYLNTHTNPKLEDISDVNGGSPTDEQVIKRIASTSSWVYSSSLPPSHVGNTSAQWNANKIQGKSISTSTPTNLQFLKYVASTSAYTPLPELGEANTASTVGAGQGFVFDKNGVNLRFKSILGSGAAVVAGNASTINVFVNNSSAIWNANKLQGRSIVTTDPANEQILKWIASTSAYTPVNETGGAGESNTASSVGPGTSLVFGKSGVNLQFKSLQGSGAANVTSTVSAAQVYVNNSSAIWNANQIQGKGTPSAPTDGQLLKYIGSTSAYVAFTIAASDVGLGNVDNVKQARFFLEKSTITTSTYTLASTDYGKYLIFDSASGQTLSLPTGLTSGSQYVIKQKGAGQVTVVSANASVTLNVYSTFNKTAGQNAICTIISPADDEFDFGGNTAG